MALILADRVKESTTTTGTSDFALGGAITGFQTFAAAVGANNTTYYAIADGSDWEVGLGTLSSDGLTLARTTVLQSSNSDSKVSFASGTKHLFVTYAADKAVFEDASGNVTLPANLTVVGGSTTDSVQLDLTAAVTPAVGQIAWDTAQGTASLGLLGGNIISRLGQSLVAYVTNAESVTITKGQAVYLFSAQGDRATVKLAYNTGDATSAKTLGVVGENIAAGQTGFVVCQGVAYGLDLSAYTAGDTLYLGATAGTLTATKPYAPNHLVYMGVVEKANAGAGQLYVRVQNGYELDEIHNVSAQSPSNGNTLVFNTSTGLWEATSTLSGSYTLSGGTANGVTYLNGSKVLTSGSALTFDGRVFTVDAPSGNTVIAAKAIANQAAFLSAVGNGNTQGTSSFDIIQDQSFAYVYNRANTPMLFGVNNSEAMRLTSTSLYTASGISVGIGTSSPAYKLDVFSASEIVAGIRSSTTGAALSFRDATTTSTTRPQIGAVGNDFIVKTGTSLPERLRIDSSGNVGIGTTSPSSLLSGSNTNLTIEGTAGGDIAFKRSGGTTRMAVGVTSGDVGYVWTNTNTSILFGTNAIERMRVSSDGNLGIGTSSPNAKLNILAADATTADLARFQQTNQGNLLIQSQQGGQSIGGTNGILFSNATGSMGWRTNASSGSAQMLLDASGNLGVGTTSPSTYGTFAVKTSLGSISIASGGSVGARLKFYDSSNTQTAEIINNGGSNELLQISATAATGAILFNTNSAERARITSAGDLLVGATSATWDEKLAVVKSTNTVVTGLYNSNTAYTSSVLRLQAETAASTGWILISGRRSAGTDVFVVFGNGNVTNTNNSYGAISDIKLKENIVDASPKLADLMQVKVRNYNLIGDTTKQLGVVAQELETVFPAMVDETPDRDAEGNELGTTTKQVKYSVFVPMLIKAIQELKAEFDAYKSTHP